MTERPILFSSAMIRAILEGRKTQTRRVMKLQPPSAAYELARCVESTARNEEGRLHWILRDGVSVIDGKQPYFDCPYGIPGDRLWVKETFAFLWPDLEPVPDRECEIEYRADLPSGDTDYPGQWPKELAQGNPEAPKWRPSIFMPRWASRITLEITDVRVQRVQEISESDAAAEGVFFTDWGKNQFGQQHDGWSVEPKSGPNDCHGSARFCFGSLWDSINAKRGFSWDVNPWVWALTFRRFPHA